MRRLRPCYYSDYPRTLTAHDIGVKDLLETFYLPSDVPDVILYAISIHEFNEMSTELSPALAEVVPEIAKKDLWEATGTISCARPRRSCHLEVIAASEREYITR